MILLRGIRHCAASYWSCFWALIFLLCLQMNKFYQESKTEKQFIERRDRSPPPAAPLLQLEDELKTIKWAMYWENLSSGACNQVRLKLACAAIEASQRLKILDLETEGITPSRQQITKMLRCTGWSASLLFAYGKSTFCHGVAHKVTQCGHTSWWSLTGPAPFSKVRKSNVNKWAMAALTIHWHKQLLQITYLIFRMVFLFQCFCHQNLKLTFWQAKNKNLMPI